MARKTPEGKWTRGSSNRDSRGNARDRRRRREFLINKFGDGTTCVCSHCPTVLTVETVNTDRITPGWKGGRYTRDNIRPSCADCGSKQGGTMGPEAKAARKQEVH